MIKSNKNKEKGFTLVELLVVIAILAVLTTVSILGYSSFVKKAHFSNDKQLVSELNARGRIFKIENGNITKESDIKAILLDLGLEEVNPQTSQYGYHIWFNIEEQLFVLAKVNGEPVSSEIFFKLFEKVSADELVDTTLVTGTNKLEDNVFRMSIKEDSDSYYLLDNAGSDLATALTILQNPLNGEEYGEAITLLLSLYEKEEVSKEIIDVVYNTVIFGENGVFEPQNPSNETEAKAYFTDGLTIVNNKHYVFSVEAAIVNVEEASGNIQTPLIEIDLPDTIEKVLEGSMNFKEGSAVTILIPNGKRVEDLFQANSTNALIEVKSATESTYYIIEGTEIYNYDFNTKEKLESLGYLESSNSVLDFVFPNTDKYLYRVGNQNAFSILKLFKNNKDTREITGISFTTIDGNATASFENGNVKFDGVGIIALKAGVNSEYSTTLYLEVLDAYNATSAISATENDVILLNDINANSRIFVSGNHTFYGNGFKVIFNGDGGQAGTTQTHFSYGYIEVTNGTLKSTQVICPLYPKSYGFTTGDVADSTVNGYYLYMENAVVVKDATIEDCYVYGARTNIYSRFGDATIKNTVLEKGATANIQLWNSADATITLENVTTIQYVDSNGVYGYGILDGHLDSGSNAKIVINGEIKQYNWVCENDANKVSNKYVKEGILNALKVTTYQHIYNNKTYVNSGIASINDKGTEVEDNGASKSSYDKETVSFMSRSGNIYSISDDDYEVCFYDGKYEPSNGYTAPTMKFTLKQSYDEMQMQDGEVKLVLNGAKKFNVSELFSAKKYKTLNSSITCTYGSSNVSIPVSNGCIEFEYSGRYAITYLVIDNDIYDQDGKKTNESKTYTKTVYFNVSIVNSNVKDAEFEFDKTKQHFYYTSNGWKTNKQYIPILNGLKIYDYKNDGTKYKVYDFDNENANAVVSIVRIEHSNENQISTTTFYLINGGVLTINYDTYADGHGSTYTTTIMKDANGKIYAVNDGVTETSSEATGWIVHYYEYTGNNGKTIRKNVDGCVSSYLENTEFYTSGKFAKTTVVDISNGRTNHYKNDGWGRDDIAILDENGLPKNGVLFTGASDLVLYKIATSTDASGFYKYRYGYKATQNNITFYSFSTSANKVNLNTNGSDVIIDETYKIVKNGEKTTISGNVSRVGFTFGGWYTQAIGGEKLANQEIDGNNYTIDISTTSDITIYAHWLKDVTISFNSQGGNNVDNICTKSSTCVNLNNIPTKAGYLFKGWYDKPGNGDGTSATFMVGPNDDYYAPESNITLYAHWEQEAAVYTVTYYYNDGVTANTTATYTAGQGALELPNPTYGGTGGDKAATFIGWYDGEEKIETNTYSPSHDVTLTAHWKEKTYTITLAGGNSKISGTFTYGNEVIKWSNPGGGSKYENIPYGTEVSFTVTNTKKGSGDNEDYYLSEVNTKGLTNNISWSNTDTSIQTYNNKFTIDGNVTFTAKRSSGSCLTAGTLITLADGSEMAIEELSGDEKILAWDFVSGEYKEANIFSITNHGKKAYGVTKLLFSDGTSLSIIEKHGLFDYTLRKFVNLSSSNVEDYVGHEFVKNNNGKNEIVVLCDYEISEEITTAYSIITIEYLDAIANDMLTLDPAIYFLIPFEIDENLKYDEQAYQRDIETIGLLTYEEFKPYAPHMTETQFYAGCGQNIKIALAKGIITMDEIQEYATWLLIDQQDLID